MIISKKRFNEEIEKAVKLALEKKEEQIELSKFEESVRRGIDSISDNMNRNLQNLLDRVDDMEEAMWRKINELSCKISHKKKPINE